MTLKWFWTWHSRSKTTSRKYFPLEIEQLFSERFPSNFHSFRKILLRSLKWSTGCTRVLFNNSSVQDPNLKMKWFKGESREWLRSTTTDNQCFHYITLHYNATPSDFISNHRTEADFQKKPKSSNHYQNMFFFSKNGGILLLKVLLYISIETKLCKLMLTWFIFNFTFQV